MGLIFCSLVPFVLCANYALYKIIYSPDYMSSLVTRFTVMSVGPMQRLFNCNRFRLILDLVDDPKMTGW
jgi:hypothetical protein